METGGFNYPSYWINNDLIQTAFAGKTAGVDPYMVVNYYRVLDPFQGEWRDDLLKNLPDREDIFTIGFSPDMSRVIYDTIDGTVLRGLKTGKEIWKDPEFYGGLYMIIAWAPDSAMAMIANLNQQTEDRQYFLIDRDGKTKRMVANGTFPYPDFLYDLSWSLDGRYLVLSSHGDTFSLLVYDVLEDQYIVHCPVYGNMSAYFSPDSQQIAYSMYNSGPLQVLDLSTGQVVELVDDGAIVGWSDKFPVQWP